MKFRPCIDLHQGKVKQIVGSSLSDSTSDLLITNFVSEKTPSWYAELYKRDHLTGGHIIKLGPDNDKAAAEALAAWPGGMQLGGGINDQNAIKWLEAGADKVIITSYVFENGVVNESRLKAISRITSPEHLVLDLSCRKLGDQYIIATDRWQKLTNVPITSATLDYFAEYSNEFLIHAVDVEGKGDGIEHDLLHILGAWGRIPITYAGGVRSEDDIQAIAEIGNQKIDFTIGSALDIFGGKGFIYEDLIQKLNNNEF